MSKNNKAKKPPSRVKNIIISLVLAVTVWITVAYLTDPEVTTTVTDLQIHLTGELPLKEKGLVVTNRNSIPPLSVVVSGKRSALLEYLNRLFVEVDVSGIDAEGDYTLTGTTSLPSTSLTIEKEKYGEIPISVEAVDEREISIELTQTGSNKLSLVKSELLQKSVKITGAKSEIEKVYGGVAEIDISLVTQNNDVRVPYLLKDINGSLIDKNETIESPTAEIPVKNTVYQRKALPVKLMLSPEMEEQYILNEGKSAVSDTSVEVGVTDGNNDEYVWAVIEAPTDEITEYKLQETSNMYIPEGRNTIKAKPDLVKKQNLEMILPVEFRNLPEGFTVSGDTTVAALVSGAEDKLNVDNVRAYADLDGLGSGAHNVPVIIYGDAISSKSQLSVNIELKQSE